MADKVPSLGFVMPAQQQPIPSAPPQYPAYPNQQQIQPYPAPQYVQPGTQPFPPPIQIQPSPYNQMPLVLFSRDIQSYLANATSFHVKQKVELLEALLGWETGNRYTVLDQNGNRVFFAKESSNMIMAQLCGKRRKFSLCIKDPAGVDVLYIDRPYDCSCCCGAFCPDKISVATPQGQILGYVSETFSMLYPKLKIMDATGNTVLKIKGPLCPMSCGAMCGSVIFQVMNPMGVPVGTISKEWSGFVRELFTDADYFSISFPYDLDPSVKALCLAALFLIDYEYFERGPGQESGSRRLFA